MAKKKRKCKKPEKEQKDNLELGRGIVEKDTFFSELIFCIGEVWYEPLMHGKTYCVSGNGVIRIDNNRIGVHTPEEWANILVHCRLHLAFGHFYKEKMPGYEVELPDGKKEKIVSCDKRIWNLACDAYISRFLENHKMGEAIYDYPFMKKVRKTADELEIYEYLMQTGEGEKVSFRMDMEGLEEPLSEENEENYFASDFALVLTRCASDAIGKTVGRENGRCSRNPSEAAAQWFINHYPLLGSLAATFQIVEDYKICAQKEIQVAAVDAYTGIIYMNPIADLSRKELIFVLAHEYLHAGLQHYERCQGREPYLWNVACDYVINGWLQEMGIGRMPETGVLYDETLKGMSAEEIYDRLLADIRRYMKEGTFRGYGKGDVIGRADSKSGTENGVTLDEFYKNALMQGLEYHQSVCRDYIPAGLIEEIRALAVPPIPWDVELAKWFEQHFALLEPRRTYARPSRRQGSTPDIPRPRYVKTDVPGNACTFGVVIDTSGSMSAKMLGIALGAIASYAAAREVAYARVVFCDATAYDAGYLATEEIAGRVTVKGRGGTILQPGIDLLEEAADFPKNGPILIITDGMIEDKLYVKREHAYLIPKGMSLPFKAKGKVFYYE